MTGRHGKLVGAFALVLALVLPGAAKAAAPAEFFGVMVDGPALRRNLDIDAETRLMAASGAGSIRVALYWRDVQPSADAPPDFQLYDRVVRAAARARLRMFPTIVRAPEWATGGDGREGAVPEDPMTYARFAADVVRRYGRGGSFWAENPGIPQLPVFSYQVWNEPDIGRYWQGEPWPSTYVQLLRAAGPEIKAADPLAQVVAAGLTNRSWEDLGKLYGAGARGLFDAAAIHPFSRRPENVVRIVKLARRVMRQNGDGRKPLVLSEISWSSGQGHSSHNYGWETTEKGQARRVRQILPLLAAERRRLGIQALYWYTWLSPEPGERESFSYSGLRRMRGDEPVSKPALRAFKAIVSRLRGR